MSSQYLDKVFSGRIIFDHIPKTAGTAVHAWLSDALGIGNITPILIMAHRNLIYQYGGAYSVLCAHTYFDCGEGLDPRYQYITLLRDPVERIISWLFYVMNNHDDIDLPGLRPIVENFIANEGENKSDALESDLINIYVTHFSRIVGTGFESNAIKLKQSLEVIREYAVVGLYDDMPQFLKEVSSLIGIATPQHIPIMNKTIQHSTMRGISQQFHHRIVALNQLDLQFFTEVKAWKASSAQQAQRATPPVVSKWKKHEVDPFHHLQIILHSQSIITDFRGKIQITTSVASMNIGEIINIKIQIINKGQQNWISHQAIPINVSYHWLSESGNMMIFEGLRSPIPHNGIYFDHMQSAEVMVEAPMETGTYILILTLVQERVAWFDDSVEFEPARLTLNIIEPLFSRS